MLWFTSFSNAGTMIANKRNMVIEIVGMIFLMNRNNVVFPRRLIEEPAEHVFGSYRMKKESS